MAESSSSAARRDARGSRALGVAHHWDDADQQREASGLGVWLFLLTEVMFFGGLFAAYVLYRNTHGQTFREASHELDILLGAVNTVVLICSSFTVALAVRAAALGRNRQTVWFLLATILFAFGFLAIKAVEYGAKFEHHLYPGPDFHWDGPDPARAEMFFVLYFAMTGLHGIHVVAGIFLMGFVAILAAQGRFSPENHNLVEGAGLYWHLVDVVWIFLFPLLYLFGA